MARLCSDEDFSFPVVEELRRLGHDVLTAQEAGQGNTGVTDSAVLAYAIARDRAVLTFNRLHCINLHRRVPAHRGIVVCTRDDDTAGLAMRIDQAIASGPSLDNLLLRINRPQKPCRQGRCAALDFHGEARPGQLSQRAPASGGESREKTGT